MKCCAVVLAAGLSTRMRQFKPLLTLGDETITDRVISLFSQTGVDVYLVVGWQQDKLRSGIKNHNITIVENSKYAEGMFTSVQAGLRSIEDNYDAFFVLPVDIPLVRPSTLKALLQAFAENPGKIIYPVFHKKRGHPPLIPVSFRREILEWQKEGGLRAALASLESLALEIIVPDENILLDIDTPEDYEKIREQLQSNEINIPT